MSDTRKLEHEISNRCNEGSFNNMFYPIMIAARGTDSVCSEELACVCICTTILCVV
jgi:hypothetical protein